ncbi:hypothetical protein GIB67_015465 [Kingdonia uniflora]|uniref:Small RNA 2'-O-methyltransferase n=1 Tax=Kingdonia uniflora TaxID=39325 RepID=A0A7J7LAC5_9MAGN|nr:hypothetical protein GIB67_015465 [Kingdonia uniflora]
MNVDTLCSLCGIVDKAIDHLLLHCPTAMECLCLNDCAATLFLYSVEACSLEYSINLLRVSEPLEDRMEQALFSPPLSKQRVEYALGHIVKSSAAKLVDFGCGSGSLLDSLLDHPTTLEKIVGVDISRKSLGRAAKVLHSKLSSGRNIKSALLYDGSITVFDSRLYGFDIGTCLECTQTLEAALQRGENLASCNNELELRFADMQAHHKKLLLEACAARVGRVRGGPNQGVGGRGQNA